mmetsp:Transcript_82870/g.173516  ORF Transcript_82870/g.173516 Transcript_82870/m.173516 type:complete len:411 (-) Transcript_82870:52-1284(-)
MSAKIFALMIPQQATSTPKTKKTPQYRRTMPESASSPVGMMKKMSPSMGTPIPDENWARAGAPWLGNLFATESSIFPPRIPQAAVPKPMNMTIRAASLCEKQLSSRYIVKNEKANHGMLPGAPCSSTMMKDLMLNRWHTFGILSLSTLKNDFWFTWNFARGSPTISRTAIPTAQLKMPTMMSTKRHPGMPQMMRGASDVAKRPPKVAPMLPVKDSMPKARPRRSGAFVSAIRLQRRGCTIPKPMPFTTRATQTKVKVGATAQPKRPMAQMMEPRQINFGRGSMSARNPDGNEKIDSLIPRSITRMERAVVSTSNSLENSLNTAGRSALSAAQATCVKFNTTHSTIACDRDRRSFQSSSSQSFMGPTTYSSLASQPILLSKPAGCYRLGGFWATDHVDSALMPRQISDLTA